MSISYEGIGEWCATFVCGAVSEGDIVKVSANGTVGKCTAGDGFCGVAVCCRDDACSVQVGGFVTVSYTGTAPAVGWTALAADGEGGVKSVTTGGRAYLVADADTTAKTVTIKL